MSHLLRVYGLFCLLASVGTAQAQTAANPSLIAAQVEKQATPPPAAGPAGRPDSLVTTAAETAPATAASAELVTVKGRVLDELNKPLAGVVVFAKDVAAIASTNADGEYSLLVPSGVNTLTFSYAGYEDQQLKASNFLPTAVRMVPAPNKKKLARSGRQ
ncbi:carboxypeptidase-like regulatory domain-containing protein [Hymenobacter sp. BT635]|uniref:Carboxypeptidase-like regulatory domain-containing protein n=1 Tax=Hymenobacter nitidus TaxID=2880929 RepID=A0ABS8AHM3_9BACT|nr:carboxypeptidase-like regulatory domain-containing protein [Hymenobacter nitidus]MCB2379167.1 carboxypeptidase-like regulatory domain-containing protein [Hymenobacter nitidus]